MPAAFFRSKQPGGAPDSSCRAMARARKYTLFDVSSTSKLNVDAVGIEWKQHTPVFVYGSVQFLRKCQSSSLSKYIFHDEAVFSNLTCAENTQKHGLNTQGFLLSADLVSDCLKKHGPRHVRPERVDKAFSGKVFTFQSWLDAYASKQFSPQLACWISPIQPLLAEWRCWIVGGKIVEISQYRASDSMLVRRNTSEKMMADVQKLANVYLPSPCVVMDVGLTREGLKIIEFNPIHSSGWYAADVNTVLSAWVLWTQSNFPESRT